MVRQRCRQEKERVKERERGAEEERERGELREGKRERGRENWPDKLGWLSVSYEYIQPLLPRGFPFFFFETRLAIRKKVTQQLCKSANQQPARLPKEKNNPVVRVYAVPETRSDMGVWLCVCVLMRQKK